MNTTTTASWPLFEPNQDNRIDRIERMEKIDIHLNGQPNDPLKNFNKMIAQNNNSNIATNLTNDVSATNSNSNPQLHHNRQQTHENEKQQQSHAYNNRNGTIMNVSVDGSHDDFDDEDLDDDDGSMDDVDSLSSRDNIYDTASYNSNDSNRNDMNEDSNERFSATNSKDDISNEDQHKTNDDQAIGPLAQLQNALESYSGRLGMNFSSPNGTNASLFGCGINMSANTSNPIGASSTSQYSDGDLYRCHLCTYTGVSKDDFNSHMDTHFDHKCPFCDYTSRTEGRLKRHIRDFHSSTPPESWAGTRVLKEGTSNDGEDSGADMNDGSGGTGGSGSKSRKYKCKQCEYVATCKQDFWDHSKSHIKAEKILMCPQCNFVTEYKHHLEYHLRNHFGSKPFKCAKCNYSCVNKSMLNSHMKSHSNIYQYRCADCSYATKYCHSLKLHLRKYNHKPATVLNLDGTPNPYPVIDVYGTRRGPRPKRPKNRDQYNHSERAQSQTQTPILTSPISPSLVNAAIPPLIPTSMPMGIPFIYPPTSTFGLLGPQAIPQLPHQIQIHHQIPHHLYEQSPHSSANSKFQCKFCEFSTNIADQFAKHLLLHVSNENKDFCKFYGTDPTEVFQQNAIISELLARQSPDSKKFLEQIAINPSFINTLISMNSLPKSEPSMALEWHSTKESTDTQEIRRSSPHQPIIHFNDNRSKPEPIASERINNQMSPIPQLMSTSDDKYYHQNQQRAISEERKRLENIEMDETIPLDLSSNKSTPPLTNENMISSYQPFMERKHDMTHLPSDMSDTREQRESPSHPQQQIQTQQSRASRRKGLACKLVNRISLQVSDDHYNSNEISDEDISVSSESIHEDSDHESITNENQFQIQLSAEQRMNPFNSIKSNLQDRHKKLSNTMPISDQNCGPKDLRELKTHNNDVIASISPNKELFLKDTKEKCENNNSSKSFADMRNENKLKEQYTCNACEITFKDSIMYTMHIGYHDHRDPYTCNSCGQHFSDKFSFYVHLHRASHK